MLCFHVRPMPCWLDRHPWRFPMRAQPCSSLALRCCCSCLLAFTMPGTPRRTTSLTRQENSRRLSGVAEREEIVALQERIMREVGDGLSLAGASAADLVTSMQGKSDPGARKGHVA